MNRTISRIALAAPVAAAIFGWSLSAAQAAPYEPSEQVQMQPAENHWPDDIVIAEPDDVDPEPEPEPEDEPADEPSEDPADEDEADDDESDQETDEDSSNSGKSVPAPTADDEEPSATGGTEGADEAADDEADIVETASSTKIAPSFGPAGVQVPLLAVVAAGAVLSGIAGWAGYRRYQLFAH